MTKEIYDEILTLARESELDGVLHVADCDPDISPEDFAAIALHYVIIKKKCEEIGK